MQSLDLTFRKFSPRNLNSSSVTLTYWFEPPEDDISRELGGVGLFMSLSGPEEFVGERVAKFVWDSFREEYLYEGSGGITERLKTAVDAAKKRLVELIKNEEDLKDQGIDLHLCSFAVHKEDAYFSVLGKPGLFLFRDDEVIDLLDMLPVYDGIGYRESISVGSFRMKKGDLVAISTPQLLLSFLETFAEGETPVGEVGWRRILEELSLFSDNMAGNQCIWLIGYKLKKEDLESEGDLLRSGLTEAVPVLEVPEQKENLSSDVEGGVNQQKNKEGAYASEESKSEEVSSNKGKPYTPGGIWLGVRSWTARIKSKLMGRQGIKEVLNTETVKSAWRKVASKISSIKIGGNRERRIFVRGLQEKKFLSKKAIVGIAIILVVLSLAVVEFVLYKRRSQLKEWDETLVSISRQIDDASAVWQTQKDRAAVESSLDSAGSRLSALNEERLTEEQEKKLAELKDRIREVLDTINRIKPLSEEIGNIEILLDTYLKIGEGVDITDFEIQGDYLYLADKGSHAVYRYNLNTSAVEKLADSQEILKEPVLIGLTETRMFVYDVKLGVLSLDMSSDPNIWEFREMAELSVRNIGSVDEMGTFGDNLYLLKRDEARVLKSYPVGAGYSFPEEYFRNGSFDKAVDLLIDGNIYVLTNASGKVFKFFAGNEDAFQLEELDRPLGFLCCGFTNLLDTTPLYIYDEENSRIVVVEKGTSGSHPGVGVMLYQYVYRGERDDVFEDIQELVVDPEEKYMYVLDGTRVLKVTLR